MIIIINAKLNILSYPIFKVLNALLITVTEEPLSELEIIFFFKWVSPSFLLLQRFTKYRFELGM